MQNLTSYLPLYGKWTKEGDGIVFTGTDGEAEDGLALFGYDLEDGEIEADINLSRGPEHGRASAMVVFRANGQEHYYMAGVGSGGAATLLEGGVQRPFTTLASAGNSANIEPDRTYKLKIVLEGQKVSVFVDSIRVISTALPRPAGTGVGLFCHKSTPKAVFSNCRASSARPKAFVAMQFSEPYNEVYRDAVEPLVREIGFEPLRIDDVHTPGIIIINDIINNLSEASIVLAEISEKNTNVYYELGLAHALGKPTLLMAIKGTSLPFDVGPHRCIFYENTIAGRGKLQESLKHSLMGLLGRSIS